MVAHHRFGRRFDEVGDAGVGKPPPQRADRRRGEDHVADQAQANQEDLRTWHSEPWTYFSIVASSISITGMSSLIGYTR